ncbi:hypothetical protein ALP72_02095 [Pseudomonas coronafaciens pv. coronafaciens]|uniref:hypothetical protein n=1 Tax=Pseudomonas syringae group TaxID=136849 RepID=UPI000EFEDF8A|nr:hypothetical protein [Pseudomonas coronafaciens]RMS14418.1 hypothetical protein ALP72_02095 [Pseudomonas coronafaciens pv. coronafaciens]
MVLTQKQRDDKLKETRAKFAEKELRHRVRPGIEQAIQRIRDRADGIAVSELLQIATMKMDLMDDAELSAFLTYPRHEILVSESVARAIYDHGIRSILNSPDQDTSDEITAPTLIG